MKGRKIHYSGAELAWIKYNSTRPRKAAHAEFVKFFDRPDVTLANYCSLCKRKGWLTGRTGQFVPGQESHNRGKTMPPEVREKVKHMWFQKGNRPHTWRGAGHERVDEKDGYVVMIVDERNPWTGAETRPVLKHRWLWEKKNGPVPEGHALKCLDGNRQNTDPDNWVAIPRAYLPRLAGGAHGQYPAFDDAPPELRPTLLAIARLEHAAREKKRGGKE